MIFWIASYPKSGNTWLRTLLTAYYYTDDGVFRDNNLLKNIGQFPEKKHFKKFKYNSSLPGDTIRLLIEAQELINKDKKICFLKTHNFLGKINNSEFTNNKNSIGAIYILRDPRNVITSLKNHFEMSYQESLEFMLNERKYTYDYFKKNDFSDFQFLSSWEKNYQTWIYNKIFPILIVKYENLLKQTFEEFEKIIDFIDKVAFGTSDKFDKNKALNAITSTNFSSLKKIERENGFSESIDSKYKKTSIPFFHLGPENDWRKKLDKDLQIKTTNIFKKNLEELNYL